MGELVKREVELKYNQLPTRFSNARDRIDKKLEELRKKFPDLYDTVYEHLVGEIEARGASNRGYLSEGGLATTPMFVGEPLPDEAIEAYW